VLSKRSEKGQNGQRASLGTRIAWQGGATRRASRQAGRQAGSGVRAPVGRCPECIFFIDKTFT